MDDAARKELDLFVIGGGSGGLAAAKRAATYGARVALAEADRVGGTCVIRGCVPKKLMVYAAQYGRARRISAAFGWSDDRGTFSWERLVAMRDAEVARLEAIHEEQLGRLGVRLVRGRARLLEPQTVEVGGQTATARHVLIATGAQPVIPEVPGLERAITSNDFFDLKRMPRTAVLIGGGYIATEFAGILQGLGCQTTLLVRSELLRGFDHDLTEALAENMRVNGIDLRLGVELRHMERRKGGYHVEFLGDAGSEAVDAETCILLATGRAPNSRGLGLEALGVELGPNDEIRVDADHQTNVPHIHAIGDVTDLAPLTPVAIEAGRTFADRLFGGRDVRMSYENIPTAVFSDPPIGTVGFTECEARARYGDRVRVYRARFVPMSYSGLPPEQKRRTLVKLVVDRHTDRVLGAHMLGDDAPEIIQGLAVAVTAGATKRDFDQTVAIHPTAAEEFVLLYRAVDEQ